jgi:RHS repeat-associated protein
MIERDRDTDGTGSLEERLWAAQDANGNITALVSTSGVVVERYAYDPYGKRTVYDANWNSRGSSNYSFVHGWQGRPADGTTGYVDFRERWVSVTLGRPISEDPLGFAAGYSNLYVWEGSGPVGRVDPYGLASEFQWHHLLPQQFEKILGDMIHDVDFGWIFRTENHTGQGGLHFPRDADGKIAGSWNTTWKEWIELQNKNKIPITKESVQKQLKEMQYGEKSLFRKFFANPAKGEGAARCGYRAWDAARHAREVAALEKQVEMRVEKQLERQVEKKAEQGIGKKFGKAIPFVGTLFTFYFWTEDVQAKGLAGGTLNSVLDATPGAGTVKFLSEILLGKDLIPNAPPPASQGTYKPSDTRGLRR